MASIILGPFWCPYRAVWLRFTRSHHGFIWPEYNKDEPFKNGPWSPDKTTLWHTLEPNQHSSLVLYRLHENILYRTTLRDKDSPTGIFQYDGEGNWLPYDKEKSQFLPFKEEDFANFYWHHKKESPIQQSPIAPKEKLSFFQALLKFFSGSAAPKENLPLNNQAFTEASLDHFPEDTLVTIFSKMLPEELLHLTRQTLSKRINKLLHNDELWFAKLKQHFPKSAHEFKPGNMFKLFWQTYQQDYSHSLYPRESDNPQQRALISSDWRELFSMAKEGDYRLVKRFHFYLCRDLLDLHQRRHFDLMESGELSDSNADLMRSKVQQQLDKDYLSPLDWLVINKHLNLLTPIYEDKVLEGCIGINKLAWAIFCQQPITKIIEIANTDVSLVTYHAFLLAASFGQLEVINHLLGLKRQNRRELMSYASAAIMGADIRLVHFFTDFLGPSAVVFQAYLAKRWEAVGSLIKQLNKELIPNYLERASNFKRWEIIIQFHPQSLATMPFNPTQLKSILSNAVKDNQLEIVKKLCLANLISATDPLVASILKESKKTHSATINWLKKYQSPAYHVLCKEVVNGSNAFKANNLTAPLAKARALLNDYTKNNSALSRFFHGHWNRHHISEVTQIVRQIDSGEITEQTLMAALDSVEKNYKGQFNSQGSFARRREFIREFFFTPLEKNSIPGM